jgi:hypothetical protein
MALVKKGSRLLTLDGVAFRWTVRRKPSYCQANAWTPLTFAVEQADVHGAILIVSLPAAHPRNWMGARTMAVRPRTIAKAIRQGLSSGWRPGRTERRGRVATTRPGR